MTAKTPNRLRVRRLLLLAAVALTSGGLLLSGGQAVAQPLNLCAGSGSNKKPNGVLQPGEQCDDGNIVNEDGCNNFCSLGTCIDDLSGRSNNCTANDVSLSLVLNDQQTACELGTDVDLSLTALLQATASERYDIGMFIALDGGAGRTGQCFHDFLQTPLAAGGFCSVNTGVACTEPSDCPNAGLCDNGVTACNQDSQCPALAGAGHCLVSGGVCSTDDQCFGFGDPCVGSCGGGQLCSGGYDPLDGDPPFFNAEPNAQGGSFDLCGDVEQGIDTYRRFPVAVTVPCQDTDGDGRLDIGSCVSWDNQKNQTPVCDDIEDALPNTAAKCRCETVNIGNVFVAGKIIVEKVCDPSDATQDFQFDSNFDFRDPLDPENEELFAPDPVLGCGESVTSVSLPPSDISDTIYSVEETPVPTGWDLTDVTCSSDAGTPGSVGDDFTFSDSTSIDLGSNETVTCTFTNVQAAVSLEKVCDELSKVGDDVDYTITLTNDTPSGATDLVCNVTDELLGIDEDITLASGDSDETNASRTVESDDPDPLVNTVDASCWFAGDETQTEVASATAQCSTDLFIPSVSIDKTGDEQSKVGDEIDYTISVENTSTGTTPPDLTCTVTDPLLGIDQQVSLAAGDPATEIQGSYTVVAEDLPGPVDNTATIDCTVDGFGNALQETDDHSVELFVPSVSIDKTGDALSKVGDTIDYTITVENTSTGTDPPDLTCTVTDPLLGIDQQVSLAAGDPATEIQGSYLVQAGDAPGPVVNTATIDCTVDGFGNVLPQESDGHSVPLFAPSVSIDKTGDALSKVGDTIDYTITVENTSGGSDPPDLSCTVTDPLLGIDQAVDLVAGAGSTQINGSYVVQADDAPGPVVNTATIDCTVDGFGNELQQSDGHSVTLLDPSFTLAKVCTDEPVPQDGPATWDLVVTNTGDVALDVTVFDDDLAGGMALVDDLAAGTFTTIPVSRDGDYSGLGVVSNSATASATIAVAGTFGNAIPSAEASDTCIVAGEAKITKLTQGLPNEEPNATRPWRFTLQDCKSDDGSADACEKDDTVIGDVTSPPSMVEFGVDLVPVDLDPDQTYRICEVLIPVAWTNTWMGDADDDGTPETAIPFVPAVDDDPVVDPPGWSRVFDPMFEPPPAIWTNDERCINFVADAGATEVFEIDNRFPGGEPRTIGYWKSWNSCTGGGQIDTAIANCGPTPADRLSGGCALLDDVLQPPGITIGLLTLIADGDVFNCDLGTEQAQLILDKRSIDGNNKKMASDAAYGLAAQLLAAIANQTAGAEVCAAAGQAIVDAQLLLVDLKFDGTGSYCRKKNDPDCDEANELAGILDTYNNGVLCAP